MEFQNPACTDTWQPSGLEMSTQSIDGKRGHSGQSYQEHSFHICALKVSKTFQQIFFKKMSDYQQSLDFESRRKKLPVEFWDTPHTPPLSTLNLLQVLADALWLQKILFSS